MMFLNLLNTDPVLMNLLNYGVEGVHYNLQDFSLLGSLQFVTQGIGLGPDQVLPGKLFLCADVISLFRVGTGGIDITPCSDPGRRCRRCGRFRRVRRAGL